MSSKPIPDMPTKLAKKAPAPPKYIVATSASGEQIVQLIGEPPVSRPKNAPELPVNATFAEVAPAKSYDEPGHRYGMKVNSRNDLKTESKGVVPAYVGSTFHHVPNTPSKQPTVAPTKAR